LVVRRGVDPEAETCWRALTELLAHPVAGVDRGILWSFDVPAPLSASERLALEAAASRSGRYVNLNRDHASWVDGSRPYPLAAPARGWAVEVDIEDADGFEPEAEHYFRAALASLVAVRRGIRWRLWLEVEDAERALALAEEITFTRSRRHGLLMNPHAQRAAILPAVGGPGVSA
jgi:hypothetical protein